MRTLSRLPRVLVLALFSLLLSASASTTTGCAHHSAIRPGAVNSFDSHAYDSLLSAQAVLEQASKEVQAFPGLKPQLNKAIDAYNEAQRAYKAYHALAVAGKEGDTVQLAIAISQVSEESVRLLQFMKGGTR
jgi:hypothetical protein